jgi:hypothetical protein
MGTIVVPFVGVGGGEGPLAWGQLQCWRAMVEIGSSLTMGFVFPFPDGLSAEELAGDIGFWMSRYASMRTRVRIGADGSVTQVVHERGEVEVLLVDAGDDEPGQVAEELLGRWKAVRFDYEDEWPVRIGFVTRGGRASHAVIAVCHLAADGGALAVMVRELAEKPAAYEAPQPLELGAQQRTEAGQRRTAASLRHWGTHLRSVPPRRFRPERDESAPEEPARDGRDGPAPGGVAEPGKGRYRRVVWDSPALDRAARRVAARTGTDTGAVLMAAFAIGLGRVTGVDPFVAQVIVSNRFRPGLADVVSPLTQNGLCVLPVEGVSLDEAFGRAVRASMSASKNAYYDPDALLALRETVERERGGPVELGVFYNDRRMGGPAPARDELVTVPPTRVLDEVSMDFFNEQLMVNIEDVPDTVRVTAEVDTAHLSMPDLLEVLRQMEAAVVTA